LFIDPEAAAGVVSAMMSAKLQHVPFHFIEAGTKVTVLPIPV
jgi:hypothetical protein